MTSSWAAPVAAADPSLVLPVGERRAAVTVPGPLLLVDLLDLGAGHGVGVVESRDGARWTVPLVRDGSGVRRSLPGDGTAARLVAVLASEGPEPGGPFRLTSYDAELVSGERGITADQTNESVVVGESAIVKWAVRLPRSGEPGSPAAQRISTLRDGGFPAMPRPWGLLERVVDGASVLLASVVSYLPGALDGWDWAVDDVRRLARGETSMSDAVAPAGRLGAITSAMHVALARDGVDHADEAAARRWERSARAELDELVATVGGEEGDRLRARAARISAAYAGFRDLVGSPLVCVHGDLHVGQVLRHGAARDYAVTDFDGNPVASAAERVARQPAALDVVGMLASLDHVGRVVLVRTPGVDADLVRAWMQQAQSTFLTAYRGSLDRSDAADLFDTRLLVPLRLQQECRELRYAVRHLPHWVYVPDLALADLLPDTD